MFFVQFSILTVITSNTWLAGPREARGCDNIFFFKMAALSGWSIVLKFDKRYKAFEIAGYFQKHREIIGYSHFGHLFEGIKKRERTTGALETSAGVPLMAISVIFFNPKRKTEKRKGSRKGSGFETKKKRKEKGGKKKTPCRIRTPGPQSRRSEFFCASHH